jgi:hypothetical protein
MYCNGGCVDITGTLNCGTCGNKCAAGQSCTGGHCTGGGSGGSGGGGAGGAANCVDAIKKSGYAYSGAQPCSACIDSGVDRSGACEALIDCLDSNYPCSGNCVLSCDTTAGATAVVKQCVENLYNASCGSSGTGGSGGGTGPCAGLCSNPTVLTGTTASGSNQPAGACFSTTYAIQGAECVNATGFKINGTAVSCNGLSLALPAKVMGGYCFQFGAADPNYASFSTY